MNKFSGTFSLIISFALLTACASNPRVQSHYDASVDFSEYQTYNFSRQVEAENPEFPEQLEFQFRAAVEQQMLLKGYTKSDIPDVLIHVTIDVENKSSAPKGLNCPRYGNYRFTDCLGYQSRSSRTTNYQPNGGRSTICNYTEGSIKVDMIDVEQKQTIWTSASHVSIDENQRGVTLARCIVHDASMMLGRYPVRVQQQIAGM